MKKLLATILAMCISAAAQAALTGGVDQYAAGVNEADVPWRGYPVTLYGHVGETLRIDLWATYRGNQPITVCGDQGGTWYFWILADFDPTIARFAGEAGWLGATPELPWGWHDPDNGHLAHSMYVTSSNCAGGLYCHNAPDGCCTQEDAHMFPCWAGRDAAPDIVDHERLITYYLDLIAPGEFDFDIPHTNDDTGSHHRIMDWHGVQSEDGWLMGCHVVVLAERVSADFDNDGDVDLADFATFAGEFGMTGESPCDLNTNGEVELGDFTLFMEAYSNGN